MVQVVKSPFAVKEMQETRVRLGRRETAIYFSNMSIKMVI